MDIFAVVTRNLDTTEPSIVESYHKSINTAYNNAVNYPTFKNGKDIVEDMNGELLEYADKSLEYYECQGKPAVYHKSRYGSYRCVTFIRTINVED